MRWRLVPRAMERATLCFSKGLPTQPSHRGWQRPLGWILTHTNTLFPLWLGKDHSCWWDSSSFWKLVLWKHLMMFSDACCTVPGCFGNCFGLPASLCTSRHGIKKAIKAKREEDGGNRFLAKGAGVSPLLSHDGRTFADIWATSMEKTELLCEPMDKAVGRMILNYHII